MQSIDINIKWKMYLLDAGRVVVNDVLSSTMLVMVLMLHGGHPRLDLLQLLCAQLVCLHRWG